MELNSGASYLIATDILSNNKILSEIEIITKKSLALNETIKLITDSDEQIEFKKKADLWAKKQILSLMKEDS